MRFRRGAARSDLRHAGIDRHGMLRTRAPGDHGGDFTGVEDDLVVETGPGVACEPAPHPHRPLEQRALRRITPPAQIAEGRLIRGDERGHRRELRGHVAEGHPRFHVERAYRASCVLHGTPPSARRTIASQDMEREIFGGHPGGEPPLDRDAHRAGSLDAKCACGERVLGFGRTDTPSEGAHRTLGAGVAVRTDHSRARQDKTEFRRDHMDDALQRVAHIEDTDACGLGCRAGLEDERRTARHPRRIAATGRGVDDVVHGAEDPRRVENGATRLRQTLECDRTGALVQEYAVYRDQRRPVAELADDMWVPDLFEQAARLHGHHSTPPGGPLSGRVAASAEQPQRSSLNGAD